MGGTVTDQVHGHAIVEGGLRVISGGVSGHPRIKRRVLALPPIWEGQPGVAVQTDNKIDRLLLQKGQPRSPHKLAVSDQTAPPSVEVGQHLRKQVLPFGGVGVARLL